MRYVSTRAGAPPVSAESAIVRGLSSDGGLYVPERLPEMDAALWTDELPYAERADRVMAPFLPGFGSLLAPLSRAYSGFEHPMTAPCVAGTNGRHYLELWHGPTSAFKDMALQALPHLMRRARELCGHSGRLCILTATSGDTGKAALEAFRGAENTTAVVFYPRDGVSAVQKRQMTTQQGDNVFVCGVEGNFDDAQTGVKKLFADETLSADLGGVTLSSANSINWGRLLPQIAYYAAVCAQLSAAGALSPAGRVNVCVPTGNFGNILACWMAREMGAPIGRLICASNANDVLTRALRTGVYDRNRPLAGTTSPSMDILISSNFERILYFLGGPDVVGRCMTELAASGKYVLPESVLNALRRDFWGGSCRDDQAAGAIRDALRDESTLLDPHTAVARRVLDDYRAETGDNTKTVIVSTASPFKFCGAVLEALTGEKQRDGVHLIEQLSALTGITPPAPLRSLSALRERFTRSVPPEGLRDAVVTYVRQ